MSRLGGAERVLAALGNAATPAFVYDEGAISDNCAALAALAEAVGCSACFSLKAFAVSDALKLMVPPLDGFAASSLAEARLARRVAGNLGTLHLTTPGLRDDEVEELARLCDFVSFNSLSQLERFSDTLHGQAHAGLRVNPQLSFVDDERYDPCRKDSKLGVPLSQLIALLDETPGRLDGISGLHLHNNCDSTDFTALRKTVEVLSASLPKLLDRLDWLNLGGGYVYPTSEIPDGLASAVELLRERHDLDLYVEPGASLVRAAGYIVASVVDLFAGDDKAVAVLDTSVNHMPEVFEYQYEPDVVGDSENGRFEYVLAGSSCLAGDLFGLYGFEEPLELGTRLVFPDMGAYTLVKAHAFNGIPTPGVYALTASGDCLPIRGPTVPHLEDHDEEHSRALV